MFWNPRRRWQGVEPTNGGESVGGEFPIDISKASSNSYFNGKEF